jgi:hypothetical protein
MKFLLALSAAVATTVILLVDPTPEPETVDTVAECVRKHWSGQPTDKWTPVEGMDATCRAIMNRAHEGNR